MKPRVAFLVLVLSLMPVAASAGVLRATLQGSSATDPDGRGDAILTFDDGGVTFTLTWRDIGAPNAAHIHRGEPGQDGPIVVDLAPSFDRTSASGFVEVPATLASEILSNPNAFYVNVHNAAFPGGVIRGSLAPVNVFESSFTVSLTGSAEVPGPGDHDGIGVAVIQLDTDTLNYTIQVDRIANPTAAHIHSGTPLESGPIYVDLAATFQGGVAQGSVPIDQEKREALLAHPEHYYVNVHNSDFPQGALRAQLANEWVLPVAGKVEGANNTNYVTDLRILNRTNADASVRIDYFELSITGTEAPTATRTVTVPALSQVVLNDVLGNVFGRSGLGAMTFTSDREMVIVGRVINDLRSSGMGTNGLFIQAPRIREGATSGAFPFLSSATTAEIGAGEGFRTNIGFFNPSDETASLTVTLLRSSDGVFIGSATIQVGPFHQQQSSIFDLVNQVPVEDRGIEDFFATWSATRPIFVYVSVTDNATGDAMVIE